MATKKKVTKKSFVDQLPKIKALKVPKTLGSCADLMYTLRAERQAVDKLSKAIKAQEAALSEHLINQLDADDAVGVKGRVANASVNRTTVANVTDWTKFYKHLVKTKDFSLMQRRLNDSACRERWEDKKNIPGVTPFNAKKVSLTKA